MILRAFVAAFWILAIGLTSVYLESARIRIGNRLHEDVRDVEELKVRIRSLEIEYNRLSTPDVLEKDVREFLDSGDPGLLEI